MMKLSHFLRSRNALSEKLLSGKAGHIKDALWLHGSCAGMSTAGQDIATKGNYSNKIFADFSVFKGKAALSMSPVSPRFSKLNSGDFKVDKTGCMMLNFWPAVGQRKYDWQKRQLFALSPTELGSLISLGPNDSCEFFHDPSMKSSNAGQVRKSLSVTPLADGSGYFLNLTVVNNNLKTNERFSVPVTKAEFAVMRTAFSFVLPHIMGWDRVTSQLPTNTDQHTPRAVPQSLDLEWDK
ncbi:hypothetical protein HHK36_007743 [Tetracentron sinense]|uniref:Uncharacterized protein n=1 Tax=Tetracentron sinense TaxID=13715 RepID=A0A834ZL27_TETSI|nr:hypothetical protein HHK36_007743 [Tetracentron sinense]